MAGRETEALGREAGTTGQSTIGAPVSVCLERGADGLHHVTHHRGGGEACTFITGSREAYRVDFGVDRFYVDERRASGVATVLEGSSTYLVATIDASGTIHPIDLVVGGNSMSPSPVNQGKIPGGALVRRSRALRLAGPKSIVTRASTSSIGVRTCGSSTRCTTLRRTSNQ